MCEYQYVVLVRPYVPCDTTEGIVSNFRHWFKSVNRPSVLGPWPSTPNSVIVIKHGNVDPVDFIPARPRRRPSRICIPTPTSVNDPRRQPTTRTTFVWLSNESVTRDAPWTPRASAKRVHPDIVVVIKQNENRGWGQGVDRASVETNLADGDAVGPVAVYCATFSLTGTTGRHTIGPRTAYYLAYYQILVYVSPLLIEETYKLQYL